MTIFLTLLLQLLPFYALILLGYIAGKKLAVKKDHIASILIYVLLPIVSFSGVVSSKPSLSVLAIPLLSFALCSLIATLLWGMGNLLWRDGTQNMLATGIANGNFGFIGLPLTVVLFGQGYVGLTALFGLGGAVFVATLGMFIVARANFNVRESLIKVAQMPIIYAVLLGVALNLAHLAIPSSVHLVLNNVISAYSIFGLMLVGIAISEFKGLVIDRKFILFSLFGTYVLWPAITLSLIFADSHWFMLLDHTIYRVLLLMSIVPVGASIVAISSVLKVKPEKAAFVVFFTTMVSLLYVPLFISLFASWF